jgi:hypothetical protein
MRVRAAIAIVILFAGFVGALWRRLDSDRAAATKTRPPHLRQEIGVEQMPRDEVATWSSLLWASVPRKLTQDGADGDAGIANAG